MKESKQRQQLPQIFKDSELFKVVVKESGIPGAGLGLFAIKAISPGEFIAEYYGAVIDGRYSYSEPFLTQDKMVFLNENYCVISRSSASRANDVIIWQPQRFLDPANLQHRHRKQVETVQGKKRNAQIELVQKQKAFIRAIQPIEPGEEIYIDYGFEYWEFFFKRQLQKKSASIG